jgi:hypothetical protein
MPEDPTKGKGPEADVEKQPADAPETGPETSEAKAEEVLASAESRINECRTKLKKIKSEEVEALRKELDEKLSDLEEVIQRLAAAEEGTEEEKPEEEPAKPEKQAEGEKTPEDLIVVCGDWDSLMEAVEEIGDIQGSEHVFKKDDLINVIQSIKDEEEGGRFIYPKSPLVNSITKTHGLRAKVKELLAEEVTPEELAVDEAQEQAARAAAAGGETPPGGGSETAPAGGPEAPEGEAAGNLGELRKNFSELDAKVIKGFGGITGVLKRVFKNKEYKQAKSDRTEAYEAYSAERAKEVSEAVDKILEEQSLLADTRAEAYANEHRMGKVGESMTKFYEKWKKLGKWRIAASIGLVGVGVVAGGVGLGGLAVGAIAAKKVLAGMGSGFGSYDLMTRASEGMRPKIALTGPRKKSLKKAGGGFSLFKKNKNQAGLEAKEKSLMAAELRAGEVAKWGNDKLDESITYYESVNVLNGKKPTEDPVYQALMEEKARRYNGLLTAEENAEPSYPDNRQQYGEEVEKERKKLRDEKIEDTSDYLKQWYLVDAKYFDSMKNFKGNKEERQKSDEYKEWEEAVDKLKERFDELPAEVQTKIHAIEGSDQSLGLRRGLKNLLDDQTTDQLYKEKYSEIEADKVWDAKWKLNPELQTELDKLFKDNDAMNQEGEDRMRTKMKDFVENYEGQKERVEKKKTAVMAALTEGMKDHDKAVEKRTKTAVRRDAYRKLVAAGIGTVIGSGILTEYLWGGDDAPEPEPKPIVEPTPEPIPIDPSQLEGVFEKGDGVIHVTRRLAESSKDLFPGKSKTEIGKWVLAKLQEQDVLEYDKAQGWGYKFVPHPGDTMKIVTDAQGNPSGITFGEGVRMSDKVITWKPFSSLGKVTPDQLQETIREFKFGADIETAVAQPDGSTGWVKPSVEVGGDSGSLKFVVKQGFDGKPFVAYEGGGNVLSTDELIKRGLLDAQTAKDLRPSELGMLRANLSELDTLKQGLGTAEVQGNGELRTALMEKADVLKKQIEGQFKSVALPEDVVTPEADLAAQHYESAVSKMSSDITRLDAEFYEAGGTPDELMPEPPKALAEMNPAERTSYLKTLEEYKSGLEGDVADMKGGASGAAEAQPEAAPRGSVPEAQEPPKAPRSRVGIGKYGVEGSARGGIDIRVDQNSLLSNNQVEVPGSDRIVQVRSSGVATKYLRRWDIDRNSLIKLAKAEPGGPPIRILTDDGATFVPRDAKWIKAAKTLAKSELKRMTKERFTRRIGS